MAAGLSQLRKQAKQMRIPGALIREAETAEQLQELIDTHASGGNKQAGQKGKSAMAPAKKKKSVPAKKGSATPVKKNTKSTSTVTKKSPARNAAPVAKKGTKKQTASKKPKAQSQNGDAGKFTLSSSIDWTLGADHGWNPRAGSPPDRILKAVRKAK